MAGFRWETLESIDLGHIHDPDQKRKLKAQFDQLRQLARSTKKIIRNGPNEVIELDVWEKLKHDNKIVIK